MDSIIIGHLYFIIKYFIVSIYEFSYKWQMIYRNNWNGVSILYHIAVFVA